mmetsp:Transcript_25776/g.78337  ORF Transcript_25776/g.78337 Transcript_25776/m.78337 type:complete len:250 (-) Transcript_25776:352-1101(-)
MPPHSLASFLLKKRDERTSSASDAPNSPWSSWAASPGGPGCDRRSASTAMLESCISTSWHGAFGCRRIGLLSSSVRAAVRSARAPLAESSRRTTHACGSSAEDPGREGEQGPLGSLHRTPAPGAVAPAGGARGGGAPASAGRAARCSRAWGGRPAAPALLLAAAAPAASSLFCFCLLFWNQICTCRESTPSCTASCWRTAQAGNESALKMVSSSVFPSSEGVHRLFPEPAGGREEGDEGRQCGGGSAEA